MKKCQLIEKRGNSLMKKILGLAVLSVAMLSFAVGCGSDNSTENTSQNEIETSSESSTDGSKASTGAKEEQKVEDKKEVDSNKEEVKEVKEVKKDTDEVKKNEVSNSDNAEIVEIGVYAADDQAMDVHRFTKSVNVYNKRVAFAALKALESNDWPNGYTSAIPDTVTFTDVTINNGLATVKYSNTGSAMGSAGQGVFIGAVLNTLTEFPTINSVKFEADGVSLMSGHIEDDRIYTK